MILSVLLLGLAVAATAGYRLWQQEGQAADRLVRALLPAILVAALGVVVAGVAKGALSLWNSPRLAASISLTHGYELYYPADTGPVLTHIYTPLSAIWPLPASAAQHPSDAIIIASIIGIIFMVLPWLIWLRTATPEYRPAWSISLLILAGGLFLIHGSPAMSYSAFTIHADGPAVGLALLSLLALRKDQSAPRVSTMMTAVVLAWLSVLTKQLTAPLLPMMVLWVLLCQGRAAAVRLSLWLAGVGILMIAAVIIAFDHQAMLFNIWTVPSKHPLAAQGPAAFLDALVLTHQLCFPWIEVVLAALVLGAFVKPLDRSWRQWLAGQHFLPPVLAALFVLPMSLAGLLKAGGRENNLTLVVYFVAIAAGTWVQQLITTSPSGHPEPSGSGPVPQPTHRSVAKILLLAIVTGCAAIQLPLLARTAIWHQQTPVANQHDVAYDYIRAHPGKAYFPWHPLSHLMAEGELYHHAFGTTDRQMAGVPLTEKHFRNHIPPAVRMICFSPPIEHGEGTDAISQYLQVFTLRVQVPELPGWNCYIRPPR